MKRKPAIRPDVPAGLGDNAASLRMALEAAGMVIWQWDLPTGTIDYSDNVPALARGPAVDPYRTVAGLLRTVHPEDREALARAVAATEKDGRPFECEYRVRMLDGRYHWILGKGKTMVIEAGKPVRILGISQDITARKETEQELRRRSRQLAELASEFFLVEHRERRRLADLLHDDLQQLLVGAGIQAHALAAEERGRRRQQLDILRRTLEEVLELSRSITRDLAPPMLPQKDAALGLRWLAQDMRKRHRLEVAVRAGPVPLGSNEAAAVLLYTAARELLLNVAKHAGVRQATLRLRCREGRIELEVSDRGRGFDPKTLEASGSSTGFGLFSVRERAELLGGALTVATAPGRGCRMVLSLPAPVAPAGEPADRRRSRRVERPVVPAKEAGERDRIRIVVADDHRTVREGIVRLLQGERGCVVVGEADNGREAVERVRTLRPDVVLMDVGMPVMDGIEATQAIARRWPGVKVIGLSMYDDAAIARRMRAAGARDYVTKSAKPQRLIKAIRGCAADRSARGRPRERNGTP